jgi:non-ribosomal peptide synthetase component F
LNALDCDTDLQVVCTFNSHLFAANTIQRWLGHYQVLVADALANPNKSLWQLALLTTEEERQLLVEWNRTKVEYSPEWNLASLFETQVGRTPEAGVGI